MSHACKCEVCVSKRTRTKDAITGGIFTVQQLGPKQSLTPSGFLLCADVPIARIGTQDYADIELPDIEPGRDGIITVERHEDDVFDAESIASFEGAPVTIEHPREPVTPENWAIYAKGVAQNVRRGEGEMRDFLMADLLVMDKGAIHDVQTKRLKEISNGYEAAYIQIAPGRARQTNIVGNHVALLSGSARCGEACSVQDSKPSIGETQMAIKQGAESLKDKLRKLFMTRDSEAFEKALSEEVNDESAGSAMPAIHIHMPTKDEESKEDKKDDDKEETKDEGPDLAEVMTKFDKRLTSLEDCVKALTKDSSDDKEEKKEETEDDDADGDDDDGMNEDDDGDDDKDDEKKSTNDSASLRIEFQDAKARAEILSPGVKLPTFDSKLSSKKTADSICALRRRALRAALTNDNADIVRGVTGGADISKMDCAAAKMAFYAASEVVKQKNNKANVKQTTDAAKEAKDINQINAEFWATRKA